MKKVPTKLQKSRGGGETGSKAGGRITGTGSGPTGGSKSVVRTIKRARVPVLSESESEGMARMAQSATWGRPWMMLPSKMGRCWLADQGADHAVAPAANKSLRKSGPDAHEAAKRGISATSPAHLTP